jgi:hypothetical protein
VNNAVPMSRTQSLRNLRRAPQCNVRRKRTVLQMCGQHLALHELHHEIIGTDIVQRIDFVDDSARRSREPHARNARRIRSWSLQSNDAVQACIARFVNFTMPPAATDDKDFVGIELCPGNQCHGSLRFNLLRYIGERLPQCKRLVWEVEIRKEPMPSNRPD